MQATIRSECRDIDHLADEIAELSAHIEAATYRLLCLIRQFDESMAWHAQGFHSCAHWLSWRVGLDLGAAREKVRVARALVSLPEVSSELERGRVSYSKVRAITRIATPETEGELLNVALSGTASHVERLVRIYRRAERDCERDQAKRQREGRYLTAAFDEDGMLVLAGRLPPEAGALVLKALEAVEGSMMRVGGSSASAVAQPSLSQRRADALARVAAQALGRAESSDSFQVVVHVDAEVLADASAPGRSEIEGGPGVSAETSQRLACDASIVVMRHGARGEIPDVGRKRRAVSAAQRRALLERDQGCRFPGCTHRHVDAHHIEHWANGGETNLDNLALLCRTHHTLVHEGGFTMQRLASGGLEFRRPNGTLLPAAPPEPAPLSTPVARLRRDHAALNIDARTSTPSWQGERMDYAMAVDSLLAQRE
jgi:hypothetical protein